MINKQAINADGGILVIMINNNNYYDKDVHYNCDYDHDWWWLLVMIDDYDRDWWWFVMIYGDCW